MNYWLLKSDVADYPITQLKKDKKTLWTGVRNYQARNYMTRDMKVGDLALFYHSGEYPGVVGVAKITKKAEPDPTQFLKSDSRFDPKATKEKPIWFSVEVGFVKELKNLVSLDVMRKTKGLETMLVLKRGNRLSITPVTEKEFSLVMGI